MENNEKWSITYKKLSHADHEHALNPQLLEKYALAAFLTGRNSECYQILERSHQSYLDHEKKIEAARCAFWLGLIYIDARETARGSGWLARGERLLNEAEDVQCSERGLFLIPKALGKLYAGQTDQAQKLFEKATTIGEQFGDADLIALGRMGQSQAMIQQGLVKDGIKLLDETMILVGSEELNPVGKGIIYCAGIETCRKFWELERGQEWTSALNRWCENQSEVVPFRGQCLVSRAEISQFYGDWKGALREINEACDLLTRPPGRSAAGAAFYRKAELHRLLGNVEKADHAYKDTSKRGRSAQPGLALLRLSQGQKDVAEASIRNTVIETTDKDKRADLLPAYIRIMIAGNQIDEAKKASLEFNKFAEKFDTPYLHAMDRYCQGTVVLAEGQFTDAREYFKEALRIWTSMNLPYETAQTRELKGFAYHQEGDLLNAETELSVARWIYEQLGASPDLNRLNRLLRKKNDKDKHGLTLREFQVLQRVSEGQTNKFIASELFISERTVDRHVSNIFNKLGVSSRVEATTFAIRNKILEVGE